MTLDKLKPGMTVYDVHRYRIGNTTMSTIGVWHVCIVSVDTEKKTVVASWNSNPSQTYYSGTWSKWRIKTPLLIKSGWSQRLATREEIAAHKAKSAQAKD